MTIPKQTAQAKPSQSTNVTELHPFPPVLTPHARVLMMGTFPPTQDKWCMPFHYPNFYNDMWRIYGMVFFDDAEHFTMVGKKAFDPEKIKAFMQERGIASCPTVRQAIREQGNAADKFLTVVESVDLKTTLAQLPDVQWIVTTGGKATEILLEKLNTQHTHLGRPTVKMPKTNTDIDFTIYEQPLRLYRLPSSSRAYPMKLEKKAACYRRFFEMAGML